MTSLGDDVLGSALTVTAHLDVTGALNELLRSATELTGARYAALSVLNSAGNTGTFLHVGIPGDVAGALAHPIGTGVLGAIPEHGSLVLEDLTQHPDFGGFPEGHPPMGSFLGTAVRAGGRIFGRLYLTEKPGGFTDADVVIVEALARAAGVAVANALTYSDARTRERWGVVAQDVATALLEGSDEEAALDLIASRVLEAAEADTVILILPSVGNNWVAEIVKGERAESLLGLRFPTNGRAQRAIRDRTGLIVDSFTRTRHIKVPELASYGPALYAPMILGSRAEGVLLLLRNQGREEFTPLELEIALQAAGARHAGDVATLVEERGRIARDLHDLAIQHLFATGMQLSLARERVTDASGAAVPGVVDVIDDAVEAVDESVRQIRSIVHRLRESGRELLLVERLRQETSRARTSLGFAPSLIVEMDGEVVSDAFLRSPAAEAVQTRIDPDVADDIVAVAREGLSNAARHASASSVTVRMQVVSTDADGLVTIEVSDDGGGMPAGRSRSSGLANLAQRARRHGGTFLISGPRSGVGTILRWQAPMDSRRST
jgi:signal transduction histidine kinase